MTDNEKLVARVREALHAIPSVEEKKMFGGLCFMVKGKMCICVNQHELLCRIGPEQFEAALEANGCRAMVHRGKTMKGFVYVSEDVLKTKKQFDYWINCCLDFNKTARASKTKKTK